MYRSSLLGFLILTILIISFTNGKNIIKRRGHLSSTRKPVSIKICGPALVRMLDMVCQRAREVLMEKQSSLSYEKRQMIMDDDPFTRTLLIKDYSRKLIFILK
jgi:hypothetical protein